MPETDKQSTKTKTGWIYYLTKPEVIQEIKDRSESCDESASIDILRKQLATLVKSQGAERKEALRDDKETIESRGGEASAVDSEQGIETVVVTERALGANAPINTLSRELFEELYEMAENKSTKLEFQLGRDNWEVFIERLELFFIATDVTVVEKKRAVLLTKISAETYTLVRDLCAPAKPVTKTYDELIELVTRHLCPKPSEAMERCKFHQAVQKQTEGVTDFVARLKSLALYCNFTDRNTALRDQLVCGLKDHDTRVELFRKEGLTYDDAYKIATGRELAKRNANTTANLNQEPQLKQELNFLGKGRKPQGKYGQKNKSGEKHDVGRRGQRRSETKTRDQQQNDPPGTCYCCGGKNHWYRNCRHRDKICNSCSKRGHLQIMCRSNPTTGTGGDEGGSGRPENKASHRTSKQQIRYIDDEEGDRQDEGESGVDFFSLGTEINRAEGSSSQQSSRVDPVILNVCVDGVSIEMEMDTGAGVAVISEAKKNQYFAAATMLRTELKLRCYGGAIIRPLGVLKRVAVVAKGNSAHLDLYVMPSNGPTLIGRDWLEALKLWPFKSSKTENTGLNTLSTSSITRELIKIFPRLFDGKVGQYNKGTLKLKLKEGAHPVALKARHLPFAIKEKVEKELTRLLSLGHIEPVGASEWATPIVPVVKSNGDVRICGNFKLTLNPCLIIDKHPLPLIDEIFGVLQGGETFSQIDLSHAYMQILVEEESRDCLTIVTHKGYFRYRKMPEGVASGPGDFQRKMEDCLRGIPNVIAYLDNIFVTGKNEQEHYDTVKATLRRLQECGLKVNVDKCDFMIERLDILGFVIDKQGLHKAPNKVKAMVEARQPRNPKELASFLGLITYYARFLPRRAENLKPLYDCTKSESFVWTNECERAFVWVKGILASEEVLAHYDPSEELVLACDASGYGLAAILSHRYKDGSERPIAYASKMIPERELNRAIIDKEAGAIIFGFKKFYNYVYGREITLRTDHRPHIFGPKKEIPLTIASRLQRWAYFLSGFTYRIEYVRSEDNGNCDALSRLPIADSTPVFERDFERLHSIENLEEGGISVVDVQRASKRCKLVSKIMRYVREGWPTKDQLSDKERKYLEKSSEFTVEKDCLLRGNRIVVPDDLQKKVLIELHGSHMGMVRMKSMARSHMWWPGIDKDIEETANACSICVKERKNPAKTPLTPWPWPDRAWSRIHSDFLGPFYGRMFLVVIDAHSKWPEVADMGQNTTAGKTIEAFEKLFARHGLPRHLVTDNGRQFASEEFRAFLQRGNVKHSFSPPYHPATNGAAENFVGTFKNKVTKIVREGKSLERAINLFLFDYRASAHATTGRSPSSLLYKRELRTRFDILKPSAKDEVEIRQAAQIKHRPGSRRASFEPGDVVMVDDHRVRSKGRVKATIAKKLSPVTYEVVVEPSETWKRHVDQIVTFSQEGSSQGKEVEVPPTSIPSLFQNCGEKLKREEL